MDPSRLVGYEKIPMNDSIYIREIVYTRFLPPFPRCRGNNVASLEICD